MLADQVAGSYLVAVDAASGEERWRAARDGRIESWTTPVVYPADGLHQQVLVYGSGWVDSYDLVTGEVAWALPGLGEGPVGSPTLVGSRLVVAGKDHAEDNYPTFAGLSADADADGDGALSREEFSTIEGFAEHFSWLDRDDDEVLTATEYGATLELINEAAYGLVAIDLPAPGSNDLPKMAWSQQQSISYISTPLVHGQVVYMVRDGGIVSSVDLGTGEVHKRARSSRSAGEAFASAVAADGKLYVGSMSGEVAVLQAAAEWEVLAVNDLGEPIYATPLPADGRLYVRTASQMYAFAVLPADPVTTRQ
jgi:outer membrane protein assembly factor BamB